jgi:HJR/Mrr/RecB family endonuclease
VPAGLSSLWFAALTGPWPAIVLCLGGVLIVIATWRAGDPERKAEVDRAKERLRERNRARFEAAVRDFEVWKRLDGVGFEGMVAHVFREQGYAVEHTPRSNDRGIDLILRKDGRTTLVQCKAYGKPVGINAVRETHGARGQWPEAEEVLVVSLHRFTKQAKEFARRWEVRLFSVAADHFGL